MLGNSFLQNRSVTFQGWCFGVLEMLKETAGQQSSPGEGRAILGENFDTTKLGDVFFMEKVMTAIF